jgi:hypothetical protein
MVIHSRPADQTRRFEPASSICWPQFSERASSMENSTLGQGVKNASKVTLADPEEYHQIEPFRVSNSMLKSFSDDPEDCWERYVAKISHFEPTPSMLWGRAFERLVLYDKLDAVVIPPEVLNSDGHRKGAKWTEWKEQQTEQLGSSVPTLTQKEWESQIAPLLVARDKALSHESAAKLLWGKAETHVNYLWDDVSTGVEIPCKCQIDILHSRGVIVDLKTANQMALQNRASLAAHILKFRYHHQAWWYRHGHFAVTGKLLPFVLVFVGSKRPHSVQVIDMEDWMELADVQIRTVFGQLSQTLQSGIWKPFGWGTIQKLSPPRWASKWYEDGWAFGGEDAS